MNGTAERAVRRVKEGTAAALDEQWNEAMECYQHLRTDHDSAAEKKPRMRSDSESPGDFMVVTT